MRADTCRANSGKAAMSEALTEAVEDKATATKRTRAECQPRSTCLKSHLWCGGGAHTREAGMRTSGAERWERVARNRRASGAAGLAVMRCWVERGSDSEPQNDVPNGSGGEISLAGASELRSRAGFAFVVADWTWLRVGSVEKAALSWFGCCLGRWKADLSWFACCSGGWKADLSWFGCCSGGWKADLSWFACCLGGWKADLSWFACFVWRDLARGLRRAKLERRSLMCERERVPPVRVSRSGVSSGFRFGRAVRAGNLPNQERSGDWVLRGFPASRTERSLVASGYFFRKKCLLFMPSGAEFFKIGAPNQRHACCFFITPDERRMVEGFPFGGDVCAVRTVCAHVFAAQKSPH